MSYSVAVFGAFSVDSFGDSMFPKALQNELSKRIELERVIAFSPDMRRCVPEKDKTKYEFSEFEEINTRYHFDAIIIGGGELLHTKPIHFVESGITYKAGELWKAPITYGIRHHIPIILNSVGMPYELKQNEIEEFKSLFRAVQYISLRDVYSYSRWINCFGMSQKVKMVPDSLWLMDEYYDAECLNRCRTELRKEYAIESDYLIFQYGTTKCAQEAAKIVKRFAHSIGAKMVAIAINGSHEDTRVVELLQREEKDIISISRQLTQMEIVSLISGATMFVGTSLHGNLTAVLFGVKNVIIDMYSSFVNKLDGFAEMIGEAQNVANDISDISFIIDRVYRTKPDCRASLIETIKQKTREHYAKICEVITKGYNDYGECNNENSYGMVSSQAALFRKAYFRVWTEKGVKAIHRVISKVENDGYCFAMDHSDAEEQEQVQLIMSIDKPTRIELIAGEEQIASRNELIDKIYVNPIVKWDLKELKWYDLKYKFENADINGAAQELYAMIQKSDMHIEQLQLKEQEYLAQINECMVEEKKRDSQLKEAGLEISKFNLQLYEKDDAISRLNLQLHEKESAIARLNLQLRKNDNIIADLNDKLEERDNVIVELNHETSDLQQEIKNKEGHIELLLPSERELILIKKSKMYKIMRFICRGLDIILFVPKIVGKKVFAFCRMLSHVNIPKLKIAWGYVKNEGVRGAYHHLMRDYHQGDLKKIEIEVDKEIETDKEYIEDYEELIFQGSNDPIVSIVIPAYNQFAYTYHCLKSILENSGDVAYEVILADDCSTDMTVGIEHVVKNIKVERTKTNLLFLKNCNHATQSAKGKYILFLNNDTQVQKDWLKPLVDLCERDETIGMTGSKLVYADGTLQEAGGIIWKDGSGWNYGRNDDAMKPEYNYVREVDYISGASIMIRRELWEQLGGFDELFAPAYCEDSDLAFQVRKAGYKVVYQPLSVVVHFEGKSNGTDLSSGIKKYQVENGRKLREKWKIELSEQFEQGQEVLKARERSKGKKIVLMVDHYVPQFDKDAGSKTIYQYLKMFVEKGYVVKFIGDNFFQHEPYTTILQQMGIEVLYGPWYAEHWQEWILNNQKYIDFAFLNRPHIAVKYIDFLKEKTGIKCIYYGHDLHFLRLKREYELTGNAEKLRESEDWKEKELYLMRNADISYYPSCIEVEEIHRIDPLIPVKAITAYAYKTFPTDIPEDFAKREGILFVGGFGHPPNIDAVLWFAKEIYPKICGEKKIPFYIAGSNPTPEVLKLDGNGITVKGFVSEEELQKLYRTCRLVTIPLRYGAGVKGKVVEALYYGTPMVTTSVGAEGIEGIEQVVNIADDAEMFAAAVTELYDDTEELARRSEMCQNFAKAKFSMDAVWTIIEEDFQ